MLPDLRGAAATITFKAKLEGALTATALHVRTVAGGVTVQTNDVQNQINDTDWTTAPWN